MPELPIVIIPARGGSKGLHCKNLAVCAGKPLLQWAVEYAQRARFVSQDRIVVTSEDDEMLYAATRLGCWGLERPQYLATDATPIAAVLRDAVDRLSADTIVLLYPNVPVRPEGMIDKCVRKLETTGCDSVRTVSPVGKMHPGWMVRLMGDMIIDPGPRPDRRQDLPPFYIEDGCCAVLRREWVMREGLGPHGMYGLSQKAVICPEGSVVDVDTQADLERAESILLRTGKP